MVVVYCTVQAFDDFPSERFLRVKIGFPGFIVLLALDASVLFNRTDTNGPQNIIEF